MNTNSSVLKSFFSRVCWFFFAEEIDATAINEQESKDDEIVNLTTLMAGLGPDTDPLGIWTSVQTKSDGNEKSFGDNGDKVEKSDNIDKSDNVDQSDNKDKNDNVDKK